MGTHRWGRFAVAVAGLVSSLAAVIAPAAPPPNTPARVEELAEGKYSYLKPDGTGSAPFRQWSAFAAAMPDWKDKAKAAHYRFAPEKPGKQCDQKDCHPGFIDAFVAKLTALPEGPQREGARVARHGEQRCPDCHTPLKMAEAGVSHRLHNDALERVACSSCHDPAPKRLVVTAGDPRRIVIDGYDERNGWPSHRLAQDKKGESCSRDCHVPDNTLAVDNVCGDCHGEGKLEVASLYATDGLVHATDRASLIPSTTSSFFVVLTAGTLGFLFLYILFDIFRSRKEGRS